MARTPSRPLKHPTIACTKGASPCKRCSLFVSCSPRPGAHHPGSGDKLRQSESALVHAMSFASMDNLIILSWNVRSLNDRALRDNVHTLVDDVRASIVFLQETKLDDVPATLMLSMLGVRFANFTYIPASNTRGGVLVAVHHPDIALSEVHLGCFSLTVMVCTQPATPAATTASAMPSAAAQVSPSVPQITMAP